MVTGLVWVSLPLHRLRRQPAAPGEPSWVTFGLVVAGGVVVDAAPVARKAIGRDVGVARRFYRGLGAEWAELPGGAP